MMKLSMIVAMARDNAIGRNNDLLWHLSADLKRFKSLTTGHTIIMGRRTWESLPNGALPNRRNVVVSRSASNLSGAEVASTIEQALEMARAEDEVFVIGGGKIYHELFAHCDRLYLTLVEQEYPDADTHFPSFDWSEWQVVHEEYVPADEKNPIESTFYILDRCKE